MKNLKSAFVIGMMLLFTNSFSQSKEIGSKSTSIAKKSPKTYLDIMVNMASTHLNYGGSNSSLKDYKKPINGIQAGVSFQAGVTPGFSLVTELYFLKKGGKLKENNPLTGKELTLRINSLELPVLARVHLGKFYMNAGPSIAYNLSGKKTTNDQSTKLSFSNASEGFKRFDAGVQIGGGFEFPFKQKRLALDIRYNHGLTNVSNGKEIYNRTLMVSVYFSKAWKTNPFARK